MTNPAMTSPAMTNPGIPFCFDHDGKLIVSMVHPADEPADIGVLIIVGGPQYRIGSHRQFLLLARHLADAGVPAMRFDYSGMGDSEGLFPGFEHVDDEIRAAIDAFFAQQPHLKSVVLWGLCEAASAIMFYGHKDRRVAGAVLLNPHMRTEGVQARTTLKHYYIKRLRDPAFWKKLKSGGYNFRETGKKFVRIIRHALRPGAGATIGTGPSASNAGEQPPQAHSDPLPKRMADGLGKFDAPTLLVLSGNNDMIAQEFKDVAGRSRAWRKLLNRPSLVRRDFAEADHTFSRRIWRNQVADWTLEFVQGLG